MSPVGAALHRPMTVDEFLAWEREQELRYEFDGVRPIPMTGGTSAHSKIAITLAGLLDARLPERWSVFGSDMKIRIGDHVRYPDVTVTDASVPDREFLFQTPVLIVEVLSKSTAAYDRTVKAAEYRTILSLRHYVMLHQDGIEATVISRMPDGWTESVVRGPDAVLDLSALGITVVLRDLYRRTSVIS